MTPVSYVFGIYVIKIDKREVLRLYFEQIYVLLLVSNFLGNFTLCGNSDNFGSYPLFGPLDQANFMFLTYVIKVDKREVLRLYFKHTYVLLLLSDFLVNLPLCGKSE